jgi:hypothetical protein
MTSKQRQVGTGLDVNNENQYAETRRVHQLELLPLKVTIISTTSGSKYRIAPYHTESRQRSPQDVV